MEIRRAAKSDLNALLDMATALWPDDLEEQVKKDVAEMLSSKKQAVFIAEDAGCEAGFIDVSIRMEYVPGATVFPMGYIEAIYVKPRFRRKGVARKLIDASEQWALERDCKHIASDTWTWNNASRKLHVDAGFKETESIVFFIKKLGQDGCH
jgi:aminoglycoside 6'-N-acetyltransferase I